MRDLRLLMVGEVRILNKRILRERHKRAARAEPNRDAPGGRVLIDLSHVVEDGMVTSPGLPAPVVCDFLSREESRSRYAPGTEFQIGRIDLCANTGTYVDSPFHRFADGIDLAELPLERLADVDAVTVNVTGAADAAQHLLDQGALLVGIDSLNIDDTDDATRPVHTTLLAAGVPICEHLTNLAALPTDGFRFSAVPVEVKGMGSFPVRAYARLG